MIADIVSISAPSQAVAGDNIVVDVSVKNISTSDKYITVTGVYDSLSLSWQFDYLLVSPGQTVIMRGYFTMLNKNVRVKVWSWWWTEFEWAQDDYDYRDISLVTLTPEFANFGVGDYNKV